MRIIDVHQHLYAPKHGTLDDLVRICRENGIVKVCVSACGALYAQPGNAAVKQAFEQYPDLIVGLGYFRLGEDEPSLVDRLHAEGFRGLKVIVPKAPYHDKAYYPVYERASRHRMPVLFHTGSIERQPGDGAADVDPDRMRPVYLDTLARAFPELTLIGAHLGGAWYEEALVAASNPNVYFDLSGMINLIWNKPPAFFENSLFWSRSVHKLMFGVDNAYAGYPQIIGRYTTLMDKLSFPEELRTKIFYGNAAKILGL